VVFVRVSFVNAACVVDQSIVASGLGSVVRVMYLVRWAHRTLIAERNSASSYSQSHRTSPTGVLRIQLQCVDKRKTE
jgi:hypothetical protein